MKKKLNFILIFIIIILVIFLLMLSYYKFGRKDVDTTEDKYTYLEYVEKESDDYDITDFEQNIISDELKSIEFFVIENDDAIYGSLFINEYGELCIRDDVNERTKYLLDDVLFKTLKNNVDSDKSGLSVYALSTEGQIYIIGLVDVDIDKVTINKYDYNIEKFTTLKYSKYLHTINQENIVLTTDGKLFDTMFGVNYSPNYVNVYDKYLILDDDTILNSDKQILIDTNGVIVKVKSIIYAYDVENIFGFNSDIIFITTSNEILYPKDPQTMIKYDKIVSEIDGDMSEISIKFTDGSNLKFSGIYDYELYSITNKK